LLCFQRLNRLDFWLRNLGFRRFFFRSGLFARFSEQFEKTVDPIESATPPVPAFLSAATESYWSDIGVARCPFAAFPATPARDARLIGIKSQKSKRGGIKPLCLHQPGGRDRFKKLVRHEETQRPFFIAGRQIRMGEMNMGERPFARVPKFARPPELGEDIRLDGLLVGRREQS
jgi:hypothetical protein